VRGVRGFLTVAVVGVEPFVGSAGARTSSSPPKNSMNAALSSRICVQPCSILSGLRQTSPGCLVISSSAACAICAALDLG
jgi:hypothetical protein